MILNQIKGIKDALEYATLREINTYLNDLQTDLLNYKNEVVELDDEIKEIQIYKLYKIIKNTDILDLKYKDIKTYLDKLITICKFIEL